MNEHDTTFPFREVLSGGIRGKTEADLLDMCGAPDIVEGDLFIYRFGKDVPPGTMGDPEQVVIQILMDDGRVGHAWLYLKFSDHLNYQEVLW